MHHAVLIDSSVTGGPHALQEQLDPVNSKLGVFDKVACPIKYKEQTWETEGKTCNIFGKATRLFKVQKQPLSEGMAWFRSCLVASA